MELVDEEVHVIARVADQGEAFLVSRHVVSARPDQELGGIVALVQVRAADRAAAVEALEVEARRAEVPEPVLLGVRAEGRAVGRDVVRDELADERPTRRHGRVVAAGLPGLATVAGAAGRADHVQQGLVGGERRQVGEHPPVAAAVDRRVDHPVGRQAVVACEDGLGADCHGGMSPAAPLPIRRRRVARPAPRAARPRGSRPGSRRCCTERAGSGPSVRRGRSAGRRPADHRRAGQGFKLSESDTAQKS